MMKKTDTVTFSDVFLLFFSCFAKSFQTKCDSDFKNVGDCVTPETGS